MIIQILASLIQGLTVLLLAPFVVGMVRLVKARLQGRNGASPFLPYLTIATLFNKEMVISTSTSWVFRAVPMVVFSTAVTLAMILPLVFSGGALAFASDFLVVAGILLVGSAFLVLGGVDSGSAFGGMGSSREMTLASLIEPTIIMIFAALSVVSSSFNLDGIFAQSLVLTQPHLLLLMLAFVFVSLAENARYPVDNPATHLELTMVHEAMVLEYSGRYLALLEYASAVKLSVFALLLANFIFPALSVTQGFGLLGVILAVIYAVIKVTIVATCLAWLESVIVKMRFYRMSEYLSLAFFTALFGMILALFVKYGNANFQAYTIFAGLAVFFVVLLFGRLRLKAILRYYALSSLSIAAVAYCLSRLAPVESGHLIIFAVVTIAVKSLLVPYVIKLAERRSRQTASLQSFLRPASSYFFAVVLLALIFFVVYQTPLATMIEWDSLLYASVALLALGLAIMIVHHNVFSQIVGLLVLENGIAIFTLATVKSLPLYIEIGVFAVTAVTALILSLLSSRVREYYDSVDTEDLRSLTEIS
jgi:formate hydrogenlyase subunit 4/hydrogenase-4 membrane subunit HyfE